MPKQPGMRCRAPEQGHGAIRDGVKVVISGRCHRPTKRPNGVCWQHQHWAEEHPNMDEVAEPTVRVLTA